MFVYTVSWTSGEALDFSEPISPLTRQDDMVKSHTHTFSGSTNESNATGSIYPIATYRNGVESQQGCLSGEVKFSQGDFGGGGGAGGKYATLNFRYSHNHLCSGTTSSNDSSATENRPMNYTIRIWKRIA